MKECAKAKGAKCRVIGARGELGYVAVATSSTSVQAYGAATLETAKRLALDACVKQTSTEDTCSIEWTGINGVASEKTQAAPARNCRPATPEIRCSSSCTNGNCIVEYENGCRIPVQVSPRFDPFSNQWTYPSPSC